MMQVILTLVLLATTLALDAQDSLQFEVASIRIRNQPAAGSPAASPDRYARVNASLRDLIADANEVQSYHVIGGPDWVGGREPTRFDVLAKAPLVPSREQMRQMVGRLLNVTVHGARPFAGGLTVNYLASGVTIEALRRFCLNMLVER